MTHNNRGRITVDLGGKWRLYSNTIPAGSRALGTITRDIGDTGALVQIEATGLYVQVNAGSVRSLPQSKVTAAIEAARAGSHGGPGRGQGVKAADGAIGLERRNISIDPESDAIAHRAGRDRSSGIREALRFWATHHAEE